MSNQRSNEAKSIKYRHVWNTECYCFHSVISSPFIIQDYGKEEWKIKLERSSKSSHHFSLYLYQFEEPKNYSIDLKFTAYNYLSPDNSYSKHYIGPLKKENGFTCFLRYETLEFMRNSTRNTIRIICEIELNPLSPVTGKPQGRLPKCDLSHDFGLLYNDRTTADMTITINNKQFHAHKIILIARSSVFAAMFRHQMKETITNNVEITDLDANIFEQLLQFIYTDQISNFKENAIDLFAAADRYDVQKLKAICEKTLHHNINMINAAEILVMADRYGASRLKIQALKFIKFHRKHVIRSEGYKNLKEHHPALIVELLETNTKS